MNNSDRLPLIATVFGYSLDEWQKLTEVEKKQAAADKSCQWVDMGRHIETRCGQTYPLKTRTQAGNCICCGKKVVWTLDDHAAA